MSANTELEPLLVSVRDVTRLTGICKSTIYQLVRDGKLRPAKQGSKTVFSYAEVRRFAESILSQRDHDTEADKRSAEAKRRRAFRQPNAQPQQSNW